MQFTLTSSAVQSLASALLIEHLGLRDFKRCPVSALLAVLFTACSRLCSITAACLHLLWAPSRETVRKALHQHLPDIAELERRLNSALGFCLSRSLRRHLSRRKHRKVAVDLHLKPYHGKPQTDADEIVRGQAKSGTTHFHAYATAYLILRGQRFTLALSYVRAGEPIEEVLKRLLRRCCELQVKASLVLLDRGFWKVAVIRYLQAARYPFLMPVIARGKKGDKPGGPSGTMAFQYWRKGGFSSYTLKESGKGGRTATVEIGVHVRYRNGRRQKHGKERLVYAFWKYQPSGLRQMSEVYRGRFAIETSYRQLNEAKAKTCSRSPSVRLLLVGLALILRNVWVYLHHEVLSTPRRGGRLYNWESLHFRALLAMLQLEAERLLGVRDHTFTQRALPQSLTS